MKKQVRILIPCSCIFILLIFLVFLIHQTVQVTNLYNHILPWLGKSTGGLLGLSSIILLIIFVALYFRLPKFLRPPSDIHSPRIYNLSGKTGRPRQCGY